METITKKMSKELRSQFENMSLFRSGVGQIFEIVSRRVATENKEFWDLVAREFGYKDSADAYSKNYIIRIDENKGEIYADRRNNER